MFVRQAEAEEELQHQLAQTRVVGKQRADELEAMWRAGLGELRAQVGADAVAVMDCGCRLTHRRSRAAASMQHFK